MSPVRALAWRTFADSRTRNLTFAVLFAVVTAMQPIAYRRTYPTITERVAFAEAFGTNKSVLMFYSRPHDLLSVGGYSAWRTGGFLCVLAGAWGMLAAVRALRAEEDAGRQELVLAGVISRGAAFAAAMLGVLGGALLLAAAVAVGSVAGGLPVGGSAFMALATVSPALPFAGAGALVAQAAPRARVATAAGMVLLGAAFLVRVAGDTTSLHWLVWASPVGWSPQMRAFADPRPAVLVLPVICGALPAAVALVLAGRRDTGRGVLALGDRHRLRGALLGSPEGWALRSEAGLLAGWTAGMAVFAGIMGLVASSISAAGLSEELRQRLARFGGLSIVTPRGYLSFVFVIFMLVVCLFACAQMAAARHEEAEGRAETLLALPVGRVRWLAGRIALAALAATLLSLVSGLLAWAGAASQHADVGLAGMLAAGANCLPVAALFLGLAALAVAVLPRAGVALAYTAVAVAFVWELFGELLGAPEWSLRISPFAHVGFVPTQAFRAGAAAVMVAVGVVAACLALVAFRRRDVVGA